MAAKKRKRTTTKRKTRRTYRGVPVAYGRKARRTRRRSSSWATSQPTKILISVFVMHFLALILKNFLPKDRDPTTGQTRSAYFGIPEKIILPLIIYLAAKKGWVKVQGLDTVALTMVANSLAGMIGFQHMGLAMYSGAGGPYGPGGRTPEQTMQELRGRYGYYNQQTPQYQGLAEQSLSMAARDFSGNGNGNLMTRPYK